MTRRGVLLLVAALLYSAVAAFAEEQPLFDLQKLESLAGDRTFRPYEGNPVLVRGEPGSWDDWAIGSMTVVKAGDTYHMYYEGWGQGTIQIGHATSKDGVHWTKDPNNPVIARSNEGWDSGGTWDAFVIYEDGVFKMWYGATPRKKSSGMFQWGYATSKDGSRFERVGRISDIPHGEVEDDHVVHDTKTGKYYMYYWDRNTEPMGLYCAISPNETDFDFANPVPIKIEGLKYPMMYKYTHVVRDGDKWGMFIGEFIRPGCKDCRIGYATSPDGLRWKAVNTDVLVGQDGEVIQAGDDLLLMYYGPDGFFDQNGCDIRLAIMRGRLADLEEAN